MRVRRGRKFPSLFPFLSIPRLQVIAMLLTPHMSRGPRYAEQPKSFFLFQQIQVCRITLTYALGTALHTIKRVCTIFYIKIYNI